jgi:hypothetical protein
MNTITQAMSFGLRTAKRAKSWKYQTQVGLKASHPEIGVHRIRKHCGWWSLGLFVPTGKRKIIAQRDGTAAGRAARSAKHPRNTT